MGGVTSAEDAIEFLLAGATAVGVGTATFSDPAVLLRIVAGIDDYLHRHGHQSVQDIVGTVQLRGER